MDVDTDIVKLKDFIGTNMNICYLVSGLKIPYTHGGAIHTLEIANNLVSMGHEVHVVAKYDGEPEEEILNGVYIHRVRYPKMRYIGYPSFLTSSVLKTIDIVKRYDIDIIHERMELPGGAGAVVSRLSNIPCLLEVNGPVLEEHISLGNIPNPLYRSALRRWRNWTLPRYGAFYTNTKLIEKIIIGWGVDSEKVQVIPNGVDKERFGQSPNWRDISEKYQLAGKNIVIFIGTYREWHGVELLIRATPKILTIFPDTKIMIIGSGPEHEKIEKMIEDLNIGRDVLLTGSVPYQDIPKYIAGATICTAPFQPDRLGTTKKYGFYFSPLKIFEYMACGKPIITSAVGEICNILEHEKDAYLIQPDAGELADAVITLLGDKDLRERLGRGALEKVAGYTWEKTTKEVLEAYHSLLAK